MDLTAFLAENAVKIENQKTVVSKRFLDSKKQPIEWEYKAITCDEESELRKACTRRVPIAGKKGQFTVETDYDEYLARLASACTVYPDLQNAELQDSYKVKTPQALIRAMLVGGEYTEYLQKIQAINGFDTDFQEKVEESKN